MLADLERRGEKGVRTFELPTIAKRAALTHHGARYDRPANFFALGWLPAADIGQARTWRALAHANAINLLAPRVGAAVVDDTQREAWPEAIRTMWASTELPGSDLHARGPLREALLEAARAVPSPDSLARARTAALLIGSAKPKGTSASENLARALGARLQSAGVVTRFHVATDFLREGDKAEAAARDIAEAGLFVLVTPLYVDSLPALATHALELVHKARSPSSRPARFVALVNCGTSNMGRRSTSSGLSTLPPRRWPVATTCQKKHCS